MSATTTGRIRPCDLGEAGDSINEAYKRLLDTLEKLREDDFRLQTDEVGPLAIALAKLEVDAAFVSEQIDELRDRIRWLFVQADENA